MTTDPKSVITLTTDFGHIDEYAGVVKGVIYSKTPDARIVDLTHSIPAYNIEKAAYLIASAYEYFPPGSIHVVIVDPGVGTKRNIILLQAADHFFLAPDNGVLSLIIKKHEKCQAFQVTNRDLFLKSPSSTFHGRDIFAPVAAHLANRVEPSAIGPKTSVQKLNMFPLLQPVTDLEKKQISGRVISIDHFGNCMTNIHKDNMRALTPEEDRDSVSLLLKERILQPLKRTYQNSPRGEALILINSRNYLEIAINQGNAAQILRIQPNDPVSLHLQC